MPGEAKVVDRATLFARLAEGHAAGITVVTPNRRLARTLRAEFDAFQTGKGLPVWEDADILPFDSWVERLYEDSLYADPQGGQPQLLSAAQEQALWESVLAKSGLLAIAETAARCADAWKLAHRWRIDGAIGKIEGSDDTRAFAGWAADYAKRCKKEGWTDAARLPDLKLMGRKPKLVVAYGFDVIPPQSREFLGLFEAVSCAGEVFKSNPVKTSFPSSRHELEAVAKWARARLERGAKRIGVVMPDLDKRRREVVRVFSQVMGTRAPFDVSVGEMLSDCPVVKAALSILDFSFVEKSFEEASQLIRSPFIGDADADLAARARLDVRLRRRLGARVSLPKLIAEADGSLRFLLERIFEIRKKNETRTHSPHEWARVFTSILEAAGFPGEREPDPVESRARAKLNEALGDFSKLAFIFEKIPAERAIQELRNLCESTSVKSKSPEAPIQVLRVAESRGLEFDALWVAGLTEGAWPLRMNPNPFLPVALQKKAGIPEASAESTVERAKRITAGWAGAAPEVVFSWPACEEDRDLLPSPLIAAIPDGIPEAKDYQSYRDLLFQNRKTEKLHDEKAPPVKGPVVRGGTRVLADQAACPFRAFARWRLGAEEMESPAEGPDASDRGLLLHALMAEIWKELRSSSSLSGDLSPVIRKAAIKAVEEMKIEGKFAELEVERLSKLAHEWLSIEARRAPFEVVSIEEKIPIPVAGLSLSGRIDRMDRLTEGEMRGSHVVIDYKSGEASTKKWSGERPEEPQVPLYAIASGKPIGAVAFGKLKTGELGFLGLSRSRNVLPEVKEASDWNALLKGWKAETEKLATQFAAGDARVDPKVKKGLQTCRLCDLQPLCRVHERFGSLDDDREGA